MLKGDSFRPDAVARLSGASWFQKAQKRREDADRVGRRRSFRDLLAGYPEGLTVVEIAHKLGLTVHQVKADIAMTPGIHWRRSATGGKRRYFFGEKP